MSLTDAQIAALLAPLDPARVRQLQGMNHLEAWDDRRWLLRVFGWGGFDIETLECALVSERSVWDDKNALRGRHSVVYRVQARLIIKDSVGWGEICHFDDGATGESQNQPSLGDAHDMALKTALSQALKRCCVNLGDQFGLSLYNGGRTMAVVGRSLAHPVETQLAVTDEVTAGELDQPEPPPGPVQEPAGGENATPPPEPGSVTDEVPVADRVAALREKVSDALQQPGRTGVQRLGRISIQAAKEKLMQEPVEDWTGKPTTVAVLIDEAIRTLSSAVPRG